jgi:thiamine pyrophosphate-dependent acetolactate synthase large subunit-like protein
LQASTRGPRPAVPAGSAAEAIVQALAEAGTRLMFGVPGGGPNLDVVGAAGAAGLRFILARGETAAVIMAATYADLTGTPGTTVVTRGPGLASAVNGIAHAALDRLPVVVIADTVAAADTSRISHQRIDQAALGRSVAKAAITVGRQHAGEAAARIVRMARAAPAGPVIANMDDSAPGAVDGGGPDDGTAPASPADTSSAAFLAGALRAARRPVLLLGADAIPRTAALRAALAGRGIPALHTYRARGVLPDSSAEAAGLVTGGTMEWPLLSAADLIIGLGVDEAEMIPASWDYTARTILITEPAASPGPVLAADPAYRGYFTGETALRMPLARAAQVLAFTGDGGLGMTLAEIETAVRLSLRVIVIVFNDAALSLIKLKQKPSGQGGGEAVSYRHVCFAAAATAMGAAGAAVTTERGLATALAAALRRPGPTVIDASVDPAGYLAVMDLSRGQAGRRSGPGTSRAPQVRCPLTAFPGSASAKERTQ